MIQQKKILLKHLLKTSLCLLFLCCCTLLGKAQSDTTLQGFSPFKFGAAVNISLLKNNSSYRALVTREYNSLTGENAMKFATLHTSQNVYAFKDGDTLVNFAQATNKRVHGHTLIWHNSLPTWVTNFVGDSTTWENLMKTHIDTVVKHYKGKVTSWDVVNEAFNDDGTLRSSVWLTNLGSNYIARAFQYAHNADPTALLFYNDYGHEYSTAKLLAIKNLIINLLAANVPIDGVGMQLHVNKNTSNNNISNAIDSMLATGLKVHIAEFDVAVNPTNDQTLTYDSASASILFGKYKFISRYAKKIAADKLYGITTWNVTDGDSWIPSTYSRPDFPLPFNSSYKKKSAFYAIKDALTTQWNFDVANAQSTAGTYTDLGTAGTSITTGFTGNAMGTDNDNSSVQNIGFNFSFNGSTYNQFVLNTNGYIKLGASAPSSNSIFYATTSATTGSVITSTDIDLIYPYNCDLKSGLSTPEYRVAVSGTIGSRICTIQFKNVADKIAPVQYNNIEFQIKLYEGSNAIEFVYGTWLASTNTSSSLNGAIGVKGINSVESINTAKGSTVAWTIATSNANNFYFKNGDYASSGPQFSTRNTFLPDVGHTIRFVTTTSSESITTRNFRSTSTDSVDLNTASNWETFNGTTWIAATLAPNGNVASGDTITILSGHKWSNTLDATIPAGVTLLFQGVGGSFTPAKTITINGTLEHNTTNLIPTTGLFVINGTLKHNTDASLILKTNTTYATGSTIWVTGVVSNTSAAQLPTACYHVIWDCPSQTSAAINTFVPNTTTTISGNLTIHSTGNGATPGAIYMGGGASARTINLAGNLLIDGGELRLVNNGGTATQILNVTGNVTISGTGKLTLNNSVTLGLGKGFLNVKGNLTNTGTLGNTTGTHQSTITFNGTGAQAYTSNALTGDTIHVTINGASTTVVTLNSDLALSKGVFTNTLGSLVISAGKYLTLGSTSSNNMNGSVTTNTVTLKSDATGTAGLGKITGSLTNTGRIMVERYIPSAGRKKYVLVTSPLQSTLNDWQEGATGGTFVAGTAGYGTQITNAVSQGTNGFDGPATSNASIFTYNDDNATGSKWVAYPVTSSTTTASSLKGGLGYLLFVRGDRSEDRATLGTSSNTTLRACGAGNSNGIAGSGTGTISRGNVTVALNTNIDKYTLIANPYPCAIDWTTGITKTNIIDKFIVYDPNLSVFVTSIGGVVTPNSGGGTSQQQGNYIQSGQAFFVQNNSTVGTHSVAFTESAKTTAALTSIDKTVFGEGSSARQQLNINAYRTVGNVFADGAVALFGANYKAAVDGNEDATKFTNFNETFGLRRNATVLGLEARPLVASTDTLYLNMSNFGKRDYSLVIDGSNFSNTTATLEDQYKATKTTIDLNGTTTYNFTVDADAASVSNNRFIITLGSTAPVAVVADAPAAGLFVKMSPNPVSNQLMVSFKNAVADETTITVINSLGQVVKAVKAGNVASGNISVPVSDLAVGVYTVQLLSGGKQVSTQKIVKQ